MTDAIQRRLTARTSTLGRMWSDATAAVDATKLAKTAIHFATEASAHDDRRAYLARFEADAKSAKEAIDRALKALEYLRENNLA